jgi:hypothetical protein
VARGCRQGLRSLIDPSYWPSSARALCIHPRALPNCGSIPTFPPLFRDGSRRDFHKPCGPSFQKDTSAPRSTSVTRDALWKSRPSPSSSLNRAATIHATIHTCSLVNTAARNSLARCSSEAVNRRGGTSDFPGFTSHFLSSLTLPPALPSDRCSGPGCPADPGHSRTACGLKDTPPVRPFSPRRHVSVRHVREWAAIRVSRATRQKRQKRPFWREFDSAVDTPLAPFFALPKPHNCLVRKSVPPRRSASR